MLFSNPDYPLFLIAVFFLYALSRVGGAPGRVGRIAVMVLLGDLVFLLLAKNPDALWDPLGGPLYRIIVGYDVNGGPYVPYSTMAWHWAIGVVVLATAIALGVRGGWLGSERGRVWIARGLVAAIAVIGAVVANASYDGYLEDVSTAIAGYGHLAVLLVLGIGIGASQVDVYRPLGRIVILFVASSLFYQAWACSMPGPYRYLLGVLLVTIVLDYFLAIWIENARSRALGRALVIVSLCSNLGILCFFKYTDFFAQDVLHLGVRRLDLILPAGISFHTFQSLSYTIDVYRKQLKATRSPIQFATFVLFFPQLVAGPIVRAQDLLPQLAELSALELEKATTGLYRIVVGLFKKIALADTLAISIVERVFEDPTHFTSLEVLAGVYGYALQIYLDFSAYSDIAIGSAQVLGFDLPENFRTPYRSANLTEFWRRWHISLSTWLRDYLYITLGGSRGAPWRTYVNLTLTMLLGGLWHGASWTFIVWGGLHGFGLAVTRFFQRATGRAPRTALSLVTWCSAIALGGSFALAYLAPDDTSTWSQLVFAWLVLTPLWAVTTAWLSRDPVPEVERPAIPTWRDLWPRVRSIVRARSARSLDRVLGTELLRIAMCAAGLGFLAALAWGPHELWIPLAAGTWALALAADYVEAGIPDLGALARRGLAVVLVFHYVCLAWIFFRATSFDNALVVLRQLAQLELGGANLVPLVTTALAVGFLAHGFADGGFRWLRVRFVSLPSWAQGALLAGAALVLRELGHAKLVKFIYFQF